jgi:hypothetical protein
MDAPSEVSLRGLRRTLRSLVAANGAMVQYLTDLSDYEDERVRRHRPSPVELCGWIDQLGEVADEVASNAILLRHVCEVLWEHASVECERRREAELEVLRAEP